MHRLALSVSLIALAGAATAEVPRVIADIAPVQSLVARVMGDLGTPELLVRPGASPHGYALRPSEAAALAEADVVFMVGERLTPWLMKPVEALGDQAHVVSLLGTEGTVQLDKRTGATFEKHDHAHGDHDHGDHGHDEAKHDDHAHKHDDHAHKHDDDHAHKDEDHAHKHDDDHAHKDHDHDHGDKAEIAATVDSHAWLDPRNAARWLDVIAAELAEHDPANADTYRANASAGQAELAALETEIASLIPDNGRAFIVFHDAYQYFEARFGVGAAGSISISDATTPSAGRIAELKDKVADLDIGCVFTEPQMNAGVVAALDLADSVRVVQIDPLGADIDAGAGHYPALLRAMATSFATCVAP